MNDVIVKIIFALFIIAAGTITDQQSKSWATDNLKNRPVQTLLPHTIDLGFTENHGMVFGINNHKEKRAGKSVLLIVRILLSIGLIGYLIHIIRQPLMSHFPLLLILSGAIGNIIDSLKYGYVIDFIHLHAGKVLDWPFLFNLADAWVCIGMGILLLQSLLTGGKKNLTPKK